MRVLLFALLSLVASAAMATVEIDDPQNLISQLDAVLNQPSFETLFKVGEKVSYDSFSESCDIGCEDPKPGTFGGCWASCTQYPQVIERSVYSADADKAVVSGTDGYYDEITPEIVRECRGNLAVRFLRDLDVTLKLPGRLKLVKFTKFLLPLAEGTPRARSVDAYSLWGVYTPEGYHVGLEVKVSVVPTAPGVGHVALFSTIKNVWFRLKDY